MRVPLEHYPGMNRLVLDWLGGDERFLARGDGTNRTYGTNGTSIRPISPIRPILAAALDASNRHWGIFAKEQLQRWATGKTFTVIAGQQVGLAGGPLYTLAKIATLLRMKRDLEAQGKPVTLFFWLATEDHDFDEVATLNVPTATLPKEKDVNRQLDLLCMRAVRPAESRSVVGSLAVPEGLVAQLLALFDIPPRPSWLREGITFRDSFAELIATLFGNDVILVDALLPELRRAGAPLFDQIVEKQDDIQRLLAQRATELKAAGYNEQVIPNENGEYTLLYQLDEAGRRQPTTDNRQPEQTSTSALTRPLLQDFVLQPDVFVGGPAEVAYYAQIAPLHELLGVGMPRVALRAHVLVAPKRIVRIFERFGIDPARVFSSADALLAEQEPEGVARIRALVEEGKRELLARTSQIGELALPADHSLAGSIQRSVGHLEFHFDKLGERAVKGLVRKEKERYAATRELVATLYPDRNVQDRVVSWFAYWCEYGQHLVDRMVDELEADSPCFKIVEL
ncbi:MAG TPA: bacillithiol biosynthesis BshC [Thermoanaerobaculia bacterium]|nr:bacillithiol biosynthesis BshC [Thermoanaerobaculia bacterium]